MRKSMEMVTVAGITALFVLCGFFIYTLITEALGQQINPDGAGNTSQGARTTCATANNYDCVNDGVSSTTAPSTTGDYLTFTRNQLDSYQMGTISNVQTASAVTVFLYHKEGGSNMQFQVSLWNAAETTQIGTTQNVTISTVSTWSSVNFTGLTLTQSDLDGLRVRTTCTKPGAGGATNCINYALYAYVTYTPVINITVSTQGTMQNIDAGTNNAHLGGSFAITENSSVSNRDVTSITVYEHGTIDASSNLKNIKLFYENDTSSPYNCASESYAGTESQYGSTDADGFSGADGSSVFTASGININTTKALCVYVVADVQSSAGAGDTIDIQMTNPSIDVVAASSPVIDPTTALSISGAGTVQKVDLRQMRFHWRNDNGSESGATSATGGTESTHLSAIGKLVGKRLRFEISNEGNKTSTSKQYRIEYASKVSTCSAASGWTDVGAGGGDWDMFNSSNITDGSDTTDIVVSTGGVTNENTTFLTPNGGVKDTSSQVGGLTLTSSQFAELEYSISPTTNATDGGTYCFRLTDAGSASEITYSVYPEATVTADVLVTSAGTQRTSIDITTSNVYLGGSFNIEAQTAGPHTISGITITASGTVDVVYGLDNIKLYYEYDTSAPYNCASESYIGTESQYGTTDTDGFSTTGTSTFVGSISVSSTQSACIYTMLDITASSTNNQSLDLQITNPNTHINASGANVAPNTNVAVPGVTRLYKSIPTQTHYHWRNNDGTESGATSATGGTADTPLTKVAQLDIQRLRVQVSNEGGTTTQGIQYRLEFAQKISTCSAATGWSDVSTGGGAWDMSASQLVEGNNTTNITVSSGGMNDENASFVTSNGGQRETTSQTGSITLSETQFVEFEYSLNATASSVEGATYCFRLTNAGTALPAYSVYPEVTIKLPTDFRVQRGVSTITGGSLTINAGTDYVAPSASTSAFIRITNTHSTGAGDSGATGNQNANDVTVYITNPSNITNSITFQRNGTPSGDTRVAWEIVEYKGTAGGENEFIVRQQQARAYTTTGTTLTSNTVAGITDDTDVAVFVTGQYNPDSGRADYNTVLSTASWDAGADTATFTRGEAGSDAVYVSYAVVEFTGSNWVVQRAEHTYSSAGSTETESITAIGSLTRAFVHTQKRVGSGLDSHANFGHEVWLSSVGQVSFLLDGAATTPTGHVSVAWIIENLQTVGTTMVVTRSNGTQSGGTAPFTSNINIGKTLDDVGIASIFMNNRSSGTGTSWPEPMIATRLISTTQYEIWMSNTGDTRNYRTEVVEWPTARRKISQNYYRLYVNNNALKPTDPWPVGATDLGENTEMTGFDTPILNGGTLRLRMSLAISAAALIANTDAFKLQYAPRITTCSAIQTTEWKNLGAIGSTTALWRGTSTPITDGAVLSGDPPTGGDLLLSVSDVAGTFEEQNNTALAPYKTNANQDIEYDWAIQNNGAADRTSYCFRMTEANGTLLTAYNNYPTIRTVGYGAESKNWRWYDDAENETPTTPLANETVAPIDIDVNNPIQLRLTLQESNGAVGTNVRFRLQFSESPTFATSTFVSEMGTCTNLSYWCYENGGGADDVSIQTKLLSDVGACVSQVGVGCGTHNESGTTTSTFDHQINAATEFAFTLRSSGARVNRVYYFRAYDATNNSVVPLAQGETYPSLLTKGASLVFTMTGISSGQTIEGITTDIATTPSTIPFGSVPVDTFVEGAHRFTIDTNGTSGYRLFTTLSGDMLTSFGEKIDQVIGTNGTPTSWASGCNASARSCFGYHSADDTLYGGSTRFSAVDTWARMSTTTLDEVGYSSQPVVGEFIDVVFRLLVRQMQDAGTYEAHMRYISVPVF
ncbi:MAG TPA: hypothetical protein VFV22_02080 [Candidatus Paceibacterota bacterium]|nr:hypothetical protein [Candidatus Paceibacterota bacterium]